MPKVKNISGQDLVVPELDRLVAAGEVVDVPADRMPAYTVQSETWQEDKAAKVDSAPDTKAKA